LCQRYLSIFCGSGLPHEEEDAVYRLPIDFLEQDGS